MIITAIKDKTVIENRIPMTLTETKEYSPETSVAEIIKWAEGGRVYHNSFRKISF